MYSIDVYISYLRGKVGIFRKMWVGSKGKNRLFRECVKHEKLRESGQIKESGGSNPNKMKL